MTTGEKIGAYLSANGIKQAFLSEKTGLSEVIISTIVNGGRRIEVTEYYRICRALGVPLDLFLEEEG